MQITVSSNEARSNLGNLLKTTATDDIVISVRNKPTAVLISYTDYKEFLRLQKLQKRLAGLQKMRQLRASIQESVKDTSEETLYREAGFTDEQAINELVELNQQIQRGDYDRST